MMRLLQGDVGCGKTIVAFGAASVLNDLNFQVAIMCPTEALAKQHFNNASKIFKHEKVCLLTSSTKTKEKQRITQSISDGHYLLVIGTHSLIQDNLSFKKSRSVYNRRTT